MERFIGIVIPEKTVKRLRIGESIPYKMERGGETSVVEIEFGKNDKVIIRTPYNQKLMKKVKAISRGWNPREKCQKISTHSLGHSFATHLLESKVDLRYTRETFSYKSSKTAEICTHASKANIASIKSPLDAIWEEEK